MNRWRLGIAVLLAALPLSACFQHESRASDGQSHWLKRCERAADCGDELSCLCGVCTRACAADATCGGDEVQCVDTAGLGGACAEAPRGVASVCLAACNADRDCRDDDDLACVQRACVGGGVFSGVVDARAEDAGGVDAGRSMTPADAGSVEVDAGVVRGVLTPQGFLECGEINVRLYNLKSMLEAASSQCSVDADCTCVSADTECGSDCPRIIQRDSVQNFAETLATVSADYCGPEFGANCGYTDVECSACIPQCFTGRCQQLPSVFPARPQCVNWSCPDGLVCHVDDTCIERGLEDEAGIATLEVAREPYTTRSNQFAISQFAIVGDRIIWLDTGTFDGAGNHRHDGAIRSMLLSLSEPTALAEGIGWGPGRIQLDVDANVFYTDSDGVWVVGLGGNPPPLRLFAREEINGPPWVVGDNWIYYVDVWHGTAVRRVHADGSGDEPFFSAEGEVHGLAAYAGSVYVEAVAAGSTTTEVLQIDEQTGTMTPLVDVFRDDHDDGPLLRFGDLLISEGGDHTSLRRHSLATGDQLLVAQSDWLDLRSVVEGFAYYRETDVAGNIDHVRRAPLEPAESQDLRTAVGSVGHVAAADSYLYWVEANRLLRQALPSQ